LKLALRVPTQTIASNAEWKVLWLLGKSWKTMILISVTIAQNGLFRSLNFSLLEVSFSSLFFFLFFFFGCFFALSQICLICCVVEFLLDRILIHHRGLLEHDEGWNCGPDEGGTDGAGGCSFSGINDDNNGGNGRGAPQEGRASYAWRLVGMGGMGGNGRHGLSKLFIFLFFFLSLFPISLLSSN